MKYAAKKIGLTLLTMVIVSFLAFLAFQVIPGDPAVKLLGTEATPERIAALRQAKICPACGAACGRDDQFCRRCGGSL